VDLYFETEIECYDWFALLEILVKKEKTRIYNLLFIEEPCEAPALTSHDGLLYNSIIGYQEPIKNSG